jgi:hypothetical protein
LPYQPKGKELIICCGKINMKIDTLTVFTHPFDYEIQESKTLSRQTLNRMYTPVMKHTFHSAGEQVKQTTKTKSAIFIFVPTINRNVKNFENQQQRFINWAQKTLGNRFVLVSPHFGYSNGINSVTQTQEILKQFEFTKNVKLKLGGQFKNHCVKRSGDRLEEILAARNTKVSKEFLPHIKTWIELAKMEHDLAKDKFTLFNRWRRKSFGKRKPQPKKH